MDFWIRLYMNKMFVLADHVKQFRLYKVKLQIKPNIEIVFYSIVFW